MVTVHEALMAWYDGTHNDMDAIAAIINAVGSDRDMVNAISLISDEYRIARLHARVLDQIDKLAEEDAHVLIYQAAPVLDYWPILK